MFQPRRHRNGGWGPYTCGPAAAVTALGRLGIQADVGLLSVDARAAPIFGTSPSALCDAIEQRFRIQGIRCRRSRYSNVEELAGPGIHIIELRLDTLTDHWATVLGRTSGTFELGDPLRGRQLVTPAELASRWRARGLVLWREAGR